MSIGQHLSPSDLLSDISVAELVKRKSAKLHWVSPGDTVYKAVEVMAQEGIGALLVMHDGRLLGMISERDYARQIILKGRKSNLTQVREIMTSTVTTVGLSDSLKHCMGLMTNGRFRHLPVVDGGRVVGIVSIGDLVRALIEQQSRTIEELERHLSGAPPAAQGAASTP